MFSMPIFKQTLKANYKLWIIFTAILCVMSTVTIAVFDPKMISTMMDFIKDTPMADLAGDQFAGMTSLLGMLSQQFYQMLAVILPMIYIIITSNSLVAEQVDRGSMAYLLSTPIKRATVVRTQAFYLIGSVLCMFLVVTAVGLTSVQVAHSGLWGEQNTPDVKAAAYILDVDPDELSSELYLILDDDDAVTAGAEARNVDEDVYVAYLELKMDMSKIKGNSKALEAAVEASGLPEAMSSPSSISSWRPTNSNTTRVSTSTSGIISC